VREDCPWGQPLARFLFYVLRSARLPAEVLERRSHNDADDTINANVGVVTLEVHGQAPDIVATGKNAECVVGEPSAKLRVIMDIDADAPISKERYSQDEAACRHQH
jgi:hypothetical protein